MGHVNSQSEKLILRIRRISGQLAGIERSLEAGVDCAEVLRQAASVRGAMNGLTEEIIEQHLREHVAKHGLSDKARAEGADELLAILKTYGKK